MIYEVIDLYEYCSLPRGENEGGYLTCYGHAKSLEIKPHLRPAMLVIAGGAYAMVSDREGEPVALKYFNEGYSAFSLKYTVNHAHPAPLLEAAMAMVYIRENAERFAIDPDHVGAIGFSAGGHLTASLATLYGEEVVQTALGKRAKLVRPTAVVLSYPVITTGKETHEMTANIISGGNESLRREMSLETRVTADTPPAFLWSTFDDNAVPVENSILMMQAYKRAGVACEFHLYESGAHGVSLATEEVAHPVNAETVNPYVQSWFSLSVTWLKKHGFEMK